MKGLCPGKVGELKKIGLAKPLLSEVGGDEEVDAADEADDAVGEADDAGVVDDDAGESDDDAGVDDAEEGFFLPILAKQNNETPKQATWLRYQSLVCAVQNRRS